MLITHTSDALSKRTARLPSVPVFQKHELLMCSPESPFCMMVHTTVYLKLLLKICSSRTTSSEIFVVKLYTSAAL